MKTIVFVSNFLSSHQEPFCEAMYNNENIVFYFVALAPLSDGRKAMGWSEESAKPYEIRSYLNEEKKLRALNLAKKCDVLMLGANNNEFFAERMKSKQGITFFASERIYKNGVWRAASPRGIINRWNSYYKYISRKNYLLCSSAYAASDYAILGSYIGRSYKWGYFPPTTHYDIKKLLSEKNEAEILWAGRMLDWKHPEMIIELAKKLEKARIEYKINVIGDGPMSETVHNMIKENHLEQKVNMLGSMNAEKVRGYMEKASIFIATSDYHEGWGAVINESMNSGCAVVASTAMGAVPFLIKHGHNGMSYKSGDVEAFSKCVIELLKNRALREQIAQNAYETIVSEWNAQEAAKRLIVLCENLLEGKKGGDIFKSGVCSRARIFKKGE